MILRSLWSVPVVLIGKWWHLLKRSESSKTNIYTGWGECPILCVWRVRFWKTIRLSRVDILCAGMHETGRHCTELLEKTAKALNDNVVDVMLLAVQKGNLELSINLAVTRSVLS